MKVILVNGSPHEHGTTWAGLDEIERTLRAEGIETEVFWIGNKAVGGCIGCGGCGATGRCAFDGVVNEFLDKAEDLEGDHTLMDKGYITIVPHMVDSTSYAEMNRLKTLWKF